MKNKIEDQVIEAIEENRLDAYLQYIVNVVSWDDLMMALANICIFRANKVDARRKSKEYKAWVKRASVLHDAIVDARTASVQKRKLKKQAPIEDETGVDTGTEA